MLTFTPRTLHVSMDDNGVQFNCTSILMSNNRLNKIRRRKNICFEDKNLRKNTCAFVPNFSFIHRNMQRSWCKGQHYRLPSVRSGFDSRRTQQDVLF
jgi:hypothetical protein